MIYQTVLKWRLENQDKVKGYSKKWREANPGKMNAAVRKYQAAKLMRTPAWLSQQDIKVMEEMYINACQLTADTGIIFSVDHDIPLQGEKVSGLHVPGNLQIMALSENCSKNNEYEIE